LKITTLDTQIIRSHRRQHTLANNFRYLIL